ncbi:MAG: hypothetical protein ACOYKO_02620 [Rhodoluna sp.]
MTKKPASAGKIVAITCGSLFGLFVLLPILSSLLLFGGFGGNFGSLVLYAAIGVGVYLLIRRSKRKNATLQVEVPVAPVTQVAYQAATPTAVASTGGDLPTTVCEHSFTAEELKGKTSVTCPCGFTFKTKDLLDYKTLSESYLRIEHDLMNVRQRLVEATGTGSPVAAPRTVTPQAAPAVKQIRKEKKSLSLQQWLIMGAAAIIVIAGSIFVSTNLDTLPEYGFLAVTTVVALVTGALAFWGRKFSVMLANFMATFSSAMLMFALLVTGDILSESFTWETAPAWFWTLDLAIVAVVSFGLARFKANFGWKIISLAAFTAAGIVFAFGELGSRFEFANPSFGWMSATLGLTGILVALGSKAISRMQFAVENGTPDREYELDLAKRENTALKNFTLFTFAAFAILALQWPITSGLAVGAAPEPVSFSAFALVTVLALATKSLWFSAVISDEDRFAKPVSTWLHIFSFTTVALALASWLSYGIGENYWAALFGTITLMFVLVGVGFNVKRFAEFPVAVVTAQVALAGSWIIWYAGVPSFSDSLAAISLLLIAFASSMLYQSWLGIRGSSVVVASVLHFVGLFALVARVLITDFNPVSLEHALISLGVIALAVSYSPATAYVNRKLGKEFDSGSQALIYILTTVVAALITLPATWDTTPNDYLYLAAVTGGSALVAGVGAALLSKKQQAVSFVMLRYSYSFQGILAFIMLTSTRSSEQLIYPAVTLLALAALNYAMAWVAKISTSVWLAYGSSLAGVLLLAMAYRDDLLISAHLALLIVIALALNYVLRIVDKRVSGKYTNYFSLISVFGLTVSSFVINSESWTNSDNSGQILLGLLILVLVAGLAAGFAELERFGSGRAGIAMRIAGLGYLFLAFVTVASLYLNEEMNANYGAENLVGWRRIFVAAVFAVIVFRQLQISSKAKSETTTGWFALSYLAPVAIALISSQLLRDSIDLDTFNLELFTVPLALALAVPALFNAAAPQTLKRLIGLDVPLLFPVAASAVYSLSQDVNEVSTVYRLVASTAILAGYSLWRFSKSQTLFWAGLDYAGLLGLGLSLAQLVEVLAPELLDGPELFGIGAAGAIVLGNRNLKKVLEFNSTIFTHGLPLFALVLPSVIFTYTTLDTSIQLTNPTQITRIVILLVIALAALLLGIRSGNLGTALAGGASLSLLLLPITWANAGQTEDFQNMVALRALGISLFLFLLLGGLRSINKLPDSSYLYLGIPSIVALGPSLFLTIASIGDSSLTRVDWWRFGILMTATVTLLVVGALRSLGGLFFPGLVGVLVGVLPYAFQPIARESWFLWVVLLLIAGVMVWIAVRLDQLRKLGKSGTSWIKSLR